MKRSHDIKLVVIGTLSLLGIHYATQEKLDVTQNSYANREDCEKDWGKDPQDCRYSGHGISYVGPRYYWDRNIGRPVALGSDGEPRTLNNSYLGRGQPSTATSIHSSSITRGGFGGFGHGSSGG